MIEKEELLLALKEAFKDGDIDIRLSKETGIQNGRYQRIFPEVYIGTQLLFKGNGVEVDACSPIF